MHLPIVCSIDSFIAAALMSFAGCPPTWRRAVIAGFAAFDMAAGLTSLRLSPAATAPIVITAMIAAALILIPARKRPALFLVVPILLSADNLALGGADSLWPALMDGILSGAMAAAGFSIATAATRSTRNGETR